MSVLLPLRVAFTNTSNVSYAQRLLEAKQNLPQRNAPAVHQAEVTEARRAHLAERALRLAILDRGHGFCTKVLFAFIRVGSRLPAPDAVKVNRYRPDFYGTPMGVVTHEAMRGASRWSVGDRESIVGLRAE